MQNYLQTQIRAILLEWCKVYYLSTNEQNLKRWNWIWHHGKQFLLL